MIKKLFVLFSIIVITTLLSFNATINIINKIERQRKLQRQWEEGHSSRLLNDVSYAYNQQLSEDPILQKEVQELTSDESIRKRFYQYEDWMQNFAEECYRKLKGGVFSCTDTKGVMFIQTKAQGSLGIILPEDDELEVSYVYSPFGEMDLSRDKTWLQDCIDIEQNMKIIRINSHWYYKCFRTKEW